MKTVIRGNARRLKENKIGLISFKEKQAKIHDWLCKMKDIENIRHLTFILSCNTKITEQLKLKQQM